MGRLVGPNNADWRVPVSELEKRRERLSIALSENGIEYIDNASMVPYLHSQIIYLTNHIETMAEQFNQLVNELQNK